MIEISHEETPNQLMVYCFEVMIEIKSFFFVFKWLLFFRVQRFSFIFLISKCLTKIILIGEKYDSLSGCKKYDNLSVVTYYQQARGVKGLENGRKQVEPRWNEFNKNREELLFQSEQILAQKENNTIENHSNCR